MLGNMAREGIYFELYIFVVVVLEKFQNMVVVVVGRCLEGRVIG